jgi:hypothetical protein
VAALSVLILMVSGNCHACSSSCHCAHRHSSCDGTCECADGNTGERTTIEFGKESDRLTGKETAANGPNMYVRTLRNIRASDTGELAFEPTTRAEVGKPSESTTPFSFRWAPAGETRRLTNDGLNAAVKKFARR